MNTIQEHPFPVGKYLVSPLTHPSDCGRFGASVSIRRGHGAGMHDRVFRFVPRFATREQAARYGAVQARRWLRLHGRP